MLCKNSFPAWQRTNSFSIVMTSHLIIGFYPECRAEVIDILCGRSTDFLNCTEGGTKVTTGCHSVRFLVNEQRDAQIPFYVFIFIYNSLNVSSISCSSSGETNCISTTSGNYHSVLVAVSCAHDTATNSGNQQTNPTKPVYSQPAYYTATNTDWQLPKLYWYNLSLLMMNTICSKHVESYK